MDESRKREAPDAVNETTLKAPRTLAVTQADIGEDIVPWLSVDDGTVGELMKFLDPSSDTESTTATRVKFIENPYSFSSLIFQSSSSYITINGNEESCGSSYSDSDSSVMASVDMGGMMLKGFGEEGSCGSGNANNGARGETRGNQDVLWSVNGGVGGDGVKLAWEWELDDERVVRLLEEGYLFDMFEEGQKGW
ncbi:hypothetical protein K2173_011757 [Erythroxylum novogranatense]|uniref:Uncharacterized protein n=1 Tax=Erythroxylum novogranatense TaxID=1862640 RepID=A0AAV8TLD3_9ROSI|nr:hypothetical protein K2173_011757 [Erythroxylum novogranatense]